MKTRYRVAEIGGMFSKKQVLILQIFKHFPDGEDDWRGMATYLSHNKWVDATPEDVLEAS